MRGGILLVVGMNPSEFLSVWTHCDSHERSSRSNLDHWLMCEQDNMTIVYLCGSHLTRL
jgi:hypothetical protein